MEAYFKFKGNKIMVFVLMLIPLFFLCSFNKINLQKEGSNKLYSSSKNNKFVSLYRHKDSVFKIAFYNVENLFDIYNNPNTHDDEYTPEGLRRWTKFKFNKKINNLFKVILSLNDQSKAPIIGLCEIENKFVLNKLIEETPLQKLGYKYIHYQSKDNRGISVALLYMPKFFLPLEHRPITLHLRDNSKTRDILYVKGVFNSIDTIHFLVCHYPSRYGGIGATIEKRNIASNTVRRICDSIFCYDYSKNIVIFGDFNDDPSDESISNYLCYDEKIINLSTNILKDNKIGTLKHEALWNVFDQVIVSENMLKNKNFKIEDNSAKLFNKSFLFVEDKKYGGVKLFRTYNGMKYLGGYSDHLPVYIKVIY
ncbi:MAG: endonuclease [Bacteroidales bacterium]|jgi:hypothetical protein